MHPDMQKNLIQGDPVARMKLIARYFSDGDHQEEYVRCRRLDTLEHNHSVGMK